MKMNPLLTCLKSHVKFLLNSTFLILLFCATSIAQEFRVTGTITSASDNSPLPGVNILIKGTTSGTITDMNGNFSLPVPSRQSALVISYVGYATQEVIVGDQLVINVALSEDVTQLAEVVVTALGVERNAKSLQSSVTKVSGANLTQAREVNLGAAIQGRVAGVDVTKSSTGPAGSSRVIIRGNKSIGGSNQPLYVVDGIPMDNTMGDQAGLWGGTDQGDGLSSLNPDDIESITVLKGANAAALYGSRGGYGVINITTKKGSARKGIGVELTSNYVFEKIINLTDFQTTFGQGGLANSDPNDPESPRVGSRPKTQQEAFDYGTSSWGERMDGRPTIMWDGATRPYSYAGDNWKRFFDTGHAWTNTIALSGGSERQTFRFSFSDLVSNSIIPQAGYNRKNLSLVTNGKFGNKVTFSAKVLYSNEQTKKRPYVSDSPNNAVQGLMRLPPNYNVDDLYGDPNKPGAVPEGVTTPDGKAPGEEYQISGDLWNQNPWWAAYQFKTDDVRDRFLSQGQLRYDITSFLYVQGRLGMDWYTKRATSLTPEGTGHNRDGGASETEDRMREINQEWMLGFNKGFGKIGVNVFVGGNKMTRESDNIDANGNDFNIPFFTSVINTNSQSFGYGYSKSGINSLFGSAEISYGDFLFLTATGRNDWFSVLNPENNSQFYPSVGASFVFSDAFTMPKVISFGKIRASWGQVATANVGGYSASIAYSLFSQGHLNRPLAQFASGDNIPNPNLVPALSTEIEFGAELRFLQNRLGIDFTYYSQKTTDDILEASISIGSGFNTTSVNIGELSNKGVELLVTGTPVKGNFSWDISLNLGKNKNEVIALNPDTKELSLGDDGQPRTRTVQVKHIVGYPFAMLTGYVQKKTPDGRPVWDDRGQPIQSDDFEILGNGVADLTGGLTNTLSYKGINLSVLTDFKFGGDIYSGTNVRMTQQGLHKQSLAGRPGEEPITVTGAIQTGTDGSGNPIYADFTKTLNEEEGQDYWGNVGDRDQSRFMYDASFIKLRQVTLGYDLPSSIIKKTPLTGIGVAFVARNLAIIYKNIDNVDPEAAYQSGAPQGLDYFGLPPTRTFGFNLRVTF